MIGIRLSSGASNWAARGRCLAFRCSRREADRRHRDLPPRGAAVHRQADRTGHELRRPGRHRHREHATAQRTARIPAAADRHRRRAQGDQPLDLRSADGARHAGRIGRPAVRGGERNSFSRQGEAYHFAANYGFSQEYDGIHAEPMVSPGRDSVAAVPRSKAKTVHIPTSWQIRNTLGRSRRRGGYRTMLGVPLMREGDSVGVFS